MTGLSAPKHPLPAGPGCPEEGLVEVPVQPFPVYGTAVLAPYCRQRNVKTRNSVQLQKIPNTVTFDRRRVELQRRAEVDLADEMIVDMERYELGLVKRAIKENVVPRRDEHCSCHLAEE